MKRVSSLVASAALVTVCVAPLSAQRVSPPPPPAHDSGVGGPPRTATDSAVRELGRSLAALAQNIQQAVTQTTDNPKVRLAAVNVAGRAVMLAQRTLVESTGAIEQLLAGASRQLEAASVAQKAKVKAGKP